MSIYDANLDDPFYATWEGEGDDAVFTITEKKGEGKIVVKGETDIYQFLDFVAGCGKQKEDMEFLDFVEKRKQEGDMVGFIDRIRKRKEDMERVLKDLERRMEICVNEYKEPDVHGFAVVSVLPYLNGLPWDDTAQNYIHSLTK